jgi:CubicO group peptidase (beta-lactamase class C family)
MNRSFNQWSNISISLIIYLWFFPSAFCQENQNVFATDRFEPFISQAFALELTPGMAVAVVQGNEIIYANGFGFAELETNRPVKLAKIK